MGDVEATFREAMSHPVGTVGVVEGRLAVLIGKDDGPRRWEWLNGDWTAIPLGSVEVQGHVSDLAARIVQARAGEGALRERVEALAADLQQDIEDRREDTPDDDGSWPITRAEWVGHIAGLGDALTQLRAALTASDVPSDGPASVPDADTADPS